MSIFGWSLPPGCGTLPGEEAGEAIELDVHLPEGVDAVYWDEDGNLVETFGVTVPADQYAGTPEYREQQTATVGQLDWDDDLSLEQNLVAACAKYIDILERRTA